MSSGAPGSMSIKFGHFSLGVAAVAATGAVAVAATGFRIHGQCGTIANYMYNKQQILIQPTKSIGTK